MREAFGDDVISPEGVNKEKLKEKIMGRQDLKKKLEAVVHPLVRKKMEEFKQAAESKNTSWLLWKFPCFWNLACRRE